MRRQITCSAPTFVSPTPGDTKNSIMLPSTVTVKNVMVNIITMGFQSGFMEMISIRLRMSSGTSSLMSKVEIIAALITANRNTLVNPVSLCSIVGPGV